MSQRSSDQVTSPVGMWGSGEVLAANRSSAFEVQVRLGWRLEGVPVVDDDLPGVGMLERIVVSGRQYMVVRSSAERQAVGRASHERVGGT